MANGSCRIPGAGFGWALRLESNHKVRKAPVAFLLCLGLLFGLVASAAAGDRLRARGAFRLSQSGADEAQATAWVTLGEDPQGTNDDSARPTNTVMPYDLTAFRARRIGDSVEFRFEFVSLPDTGSTPPSGVPLGSKVRWLMNTQRNSDEWWVMADFDALRENFWIARWVGLGDSFDWWEVEGEYNADDSYISVLVPIRLLGGTGTVLSACRSAEDGYDGTDVPTGYCRPELSEFDVEVIAHAGPHLHEPPYGGGTGTVTGPAGLLGPEGDIFVDSLSTTGSYRIPRAKR